VFSIVLGGLEGWLMAHRQIAPDVTLIMEAGPIPYGTKPVVSQVFEETAKRFLIWELDSVKGSAPGIWRQRITNNNKVEEDWLGITNSIESRDHPNDETKDTTAALQYSAADMTIGSLAAKIEEVEGERVVANNGTTFRAWNTLFTSKTSKGHMT